jgi:hypothetical protein
VRVCSSANVVGVAFWQSPMNRKIAAVLLISLALVAKAVATTAYPLKPSANGRYLLDSNNVAFLVIGDAPHSILANLNSVFDAKTWHTEHSCQNLFRASFRPFSESCPLKRMFLALQGNSFRQFLRPTNFADSAWKLLSGSTRKSEYGRVRKVSPPFT